MFTATHRKRFQLGCVSIQQSAFVKNLMITEDGNVHLGRQQ